MTDADFKKIGVHLRLAEVNVVRLEVTDNTQVGLIALSESADVAFAPPQFVAPGETPGEGQGQFSREPDENGEQTRIRFKTTPTDNSEPDHGGGDGNLSVTLTPLDGSAPVTKTTLSYYSPSSSSRSDTAPRKFQFDEMGKVNLRYTDDEAHPALNEVTITGKNLNLVASIDVNEIELAGHDHHPSHIKSSDVHHFQLGPGGRWIKFKTWTKRPNHRHPHRGGDGHISVTLNPVDSAAGQATRTPASTYN